MAKTVKFASWAGIKYNRYFHLLSEDGWAHSYMCGIGTDSRVCVDIAPAYVYSKSLCA